MLEITPMTRTDYREARALWDATEGISLDESDSEESLVRFFERNPGFSFVARLNNQFVGVVMGGHDLRRGFVYHLAVAVNHRRQGIGRSLVMRCLEALREAGVRKCHLFVEADNEEGKAFWNHIGWTERHDIIPMSIRLS